MTRATALHSARVVARFALAGLVLFGGKRLLWPQDEARRPLVVKVASEASERELREAIDAAVLLDVAERAGWPRSDAVVRERVLSGLARVEDVSADSQAAVERGVALGLHRNDPVARERLLSNARRELEHSGLATTISDDELRAHIDAHPERYLQPARMRIRQLFFSRQARGGELERDVASALARLQADPYTALDDLAATSDPWPWTDERATYTAARLDALAGEGFGEAVARAPLRLWTGPIRSSFGAHFVFVEERAQERAPTLAAVASRARAELIEERRETARDGQLAALRARYDLVIVRQP